MASIEQLQVLFQELGPATEGISEVYQDAAGQWGVVFHETTGIILEFDPEQQKLILTTELGAPPADRRLETYELLLISNYARSETGGISMALNGPQGEVTQMYELNTADLTLQTLQAVLVNFAAKSEFWKEAVAQGIPHEQEEKAELEEVAAGDFQFMRV